MCDTCNKKQDALKGLKLHKLPYFLTVLLKRFEFDFATMRRLKLGNKISFPLVLDMNPFVNEGENVNVSIEEAFGIPTGEQLVSSSLRGPFLIWVLIALLYLGCRRD